MNAISYFALLSSILCFSGCSKSHPNATTSQKSDSASQVAKTSESANDTQVVTIRPGDNAEKEAQEALILAEPGDTIEFAEGTFEFRGTLSLNGIADITIRGKGMNKSILNFTGQRSGAGGEGLKIKGNNFVIADLCIQNAPGDAIKVEDSKRVSIRRVKTNWTRGPSDQNGAYGIYPVLCYDVLIEHCVAECASDAGIYVGQTERAIVRYNKAERNVAGIEIENTIGADVYENDATNNTGGILVFSLPGLKLKNGSQCRVHKNRLIDNNHPNFATAGAMVASVPPGTGLMIMANDQVEIFDNDIHGNSTTNCAIVSFLTTQRKFNDTEYDPYPEAIYIHDNRFANGGKSPQGQFGKMFEQIAGLPIPDIVIDGVN
ncbi:MAG: parallel beta-helix domain-containing protein, partial [Pirellula sp.]